MESKIFKELKKKKVDIDKKENHLKKLLEDTKREEKLKINAKNLLFCDFSKQRVDSAILKLLFDLSKESKAKEKFISMYNGEKINFSENRAALHTALRSLNSLKKDDYYLEIKKELKNIENFSNDIISGKLKGSNGKKISDIIVVGIGGSSSGTLFVSKALEGFKKQNMNIHFLHNIDDSLYNNIIQKISLDKSVWIVVSKSNSTMETLLNEERVEKLLKKNGLDAKKHIVSISSKGKIRKEKVLKRLKAFNMFDFVGGRFSLSSASSGVPLSLYLGFENFKRFLKGAEAIDNYILNAPAEKNPALISALIDVWNVKILGYKAKAILPYPYVLKEFVPHIAQLVMESLGKGFDNTDKKLKEQEGYVLFGDSGLNAQHSFMQMAHQGLPFPIDFISTKKPFSKDIEVNKRIEANMTAQAETLAFGDGRKFEGNKPSSTIRVKEISPESIGALTAFYEAEVVFYAFILNINPFDQPGVELAKKNAKIELCTKLSKSNG